MLTEHTLLEGGECVGNCVRRNIITLRKYCISILLSTIQHYMHIVTLLFYLQANSTQKTVNNLQKKQLIWQKQNGK